MTPFEENFIEDQKEIWRLQDEGHTAHCACRLVWGDGECECELKGKKPPIISQMILKAMNNPCKVHQFRKDKDGSFLCELCGKRV